MAKFQCVGTTPTNQNTVAEELRTNQIPGMPLTIRSRIFLSFRVLSNNIKIKIWACRTTILLVLCACETASYIERKKQAETAREFGAEGDIWYLRGRRSDRGLEETA